MKTPRLVKTTAVRLAFQYALAYLVVLGIALGAFLLTTRHYVDSELETELEQEFATLLNKHDEGGTSLLAATVNRQQQDAQKTGRNYLLVTRNGEKLAGNLLDWPDETSIPFDSAVHNAWFDEDIIPGDRYDDDVLLPAIATEFPDGSRLLLSHSIPQIEKLNEFTEFLLEILSVAVILGLVMSVILGRTILRRMDTISQTAGNIMGGDLSQRVPLSGRNDEFDALASRLNLMLDRIQLLIKGIREVTDNIAHDLRSPLTRLHNQLEITLLEDRNPQEYRNALKRGIAETESLIRTFNALLSIAQAESGNHRTEWGAVNLDELVHDLVDLYRPSAEEKGLQLELITDNGAAITGSRDLLAQAIGNLLENAIKFTPAGGLISLQLMPGRKTVDIIVSDTGDGIPESEREHVLERFVRLESARKTPGNGLGLSLVQAVAALHKAELLLGDAGPGLVVTLRFPQNTS